LFQAQIVNTLHKCDNMDDDDDNDDDDDDDDNNNPLFLIVLTLQTNGRLCN